MNARLNMGQVQPEAYRAMMGLEKYLHSVELSVTHQDLIKIRASQINGCAYCINMHTKDAKKHGETDQRMFLLDAWKETGLYTEEERAVLALTEEITVIHQHPSDEVYKKAASLFSETYLAQIIMAVTIINAWNRIGIITQMQPE
ncbi:MAG: carboxymuconolactone decarboxylase family protein [Bacteroidota bacterium]